MEDIATSLVTLSCADRSPASLVRTVHILKNVAAKNDVALEIDVRDVVDALLSGDDDQAVVKIPEMENFSGVTLFNSDRHACVLKTSHHERRVKSVTTDGRHVFVTNDSGCRIFKIGTGDGGSVKNFVYAKTETCDAGFIAATRSALIRHSLGHGNQTDGRLCDVIDKLTLEPVRSLEIPPELNLGQVCNQTQFLCY